MLDFKRFLRAVSGLAVATLPFAATHSAAFAAAAHTGTFHPRIAIPKPRPLFRIDGAKSLATPRYTIVDRGAPSGSRFGLAYQPIVFNNTGQIAGAASDSLKQSSGNGCELYDGKRFRDLSSASSIIACDVNAINDATDASVDVVGTAQTVSSGQDYKAFYAVVPLAPGGYKETIFPNDQSLLSGINAAGTAVGIGDYTPVAGFATQRPPFLATPGRGLALLQPACTLPAPGCGGYNRSFDDPEQTACVFGGCQITADGTLLLSDLYTGSYETIAPDGSAHDIALAGDLNSVPTINNAKQLVYSIVKIIAGVTQVRTQLYAIATGKVTTLPTIPGNSCQQYTPLSFNNAGHVLGYTSACPKNDATYFTYDPAHGTRDLIAAIPTGSASLEPQAINDKDEILISFAPTTSYVIHWGLLEPIAADARHRATASTSHWAMLGAPGASAAASPRRTLAASHDGATLPLESRRSARLRPMPMRLRARTTGSSAPQYSVVDYGAPAVPNYALEMPTALNNTGQIVGSARDLPYVNSSTCVLFDGSRFRNISASPSFTSCTPRSINDENASTGRLSVVGTALSAYSLGDDPLASDEKAFEATIAPGTGFVGTTLFGANDLSDLTGINASGLAVGVGEYAITASPLATDVQTPYFLAPGKLSLAPLQPSCVTVNSATCGFIEELSCAFGGCNITADGSLYFYDEVVEPDGTVVPVQFDGVFYGSIINNAKQILYYRPIAHKTGADSYSTEVYQVGTGKITTVPPIAGSTCANYLPISFNNVGQVLGYTSYCASATDATYYIYDPVNGTRDLLAELPAGDGSIEPIGVNDKGEIAFGLTLPSGITHWGLLEPSTSASRMRVNARHGFTTFR